jgi:2-oxoglutarate/2-oxoacid ferredoxin oxidoreductase subunit alpha
MHTTTSRTAIKIAGESGSLSTAGNIVIECLRKLGYWVYSEREFPSLIKGGRANFQINYAKFPVRSLSHNIPIGIALDREGVLDCLDTLADGGILIHGFDRWQKVIKDLPQRAQEKNLTVIEIPARIIAEELGGSVIMVNTILIGYLFKVLGLDLAPMIESLTKQLSKKPLLLDINIECAKAGYNFQTETELPKLTSVDQESPINSSTNKNTIFVDGNASIALGAIQAGCRVHYQYPMSPSTTVLVNLAAWAVESGMLIKQAEDEISAAQLALGSMHAGTRALTATSGGGFDLMTETVSLSGMIETPLVIVNVQRPGPATGLPTWTAQADLNLAIYSGHGEYGKIVIACSDPLSCYENIQNAFNLAEKYQVPVMLLSEANIAMSSVTIDEFKQNYIPIERYLATDLENVKPEDRYAITESGISTRWIPSSSTSTYYANGDEHTPDGSLDESPATGDMILKRVRKLATIESELPEPVIYGEPEGADISFIGWGSTKSTILDAIDQIKLLGLSTKVNYLHYTYMFPLRTDLLQKFVKANSNVVIIEGNVTGQLGDLIASKTGIILNNKFLKYNGRPFYVEEILDEIAKRVK